MPTSILKTVNEIFLFRQTLIIKILWSVPDVRLRPEEEVKPHECCHHDHVADDADEITDFVDEEEPFVH